MQDDEHDAKPTFEIVHENPLHSRYFSVFDRLVRFNIGGVRKDVHYDVAGHPRASFRFAVIFPFHAGTREVSFVIILKADGYCIGEQFCMSCHRLP
jgi:hypothetical protein